MPLRNNAINYLNNIVNIGETDIYEFGINHGHSFYKINEYLLKNNIKPNKIWGFDSFVGLPKEKGGLKIISTWEEGCFNVKKEMGVNTTEEVIQNILKNNNTNIECEFVAGFYKDVLIDDIIKKKSLKKASFIDIDVDLYQSTIEVFEFFIQNDLFNDIVIINFDDWGGLPEYSGGESLAFKEMVEKYNLNATEIFTTGVNWVGGVNHVQKVFKIIK